MNSTTKKITIIVGEAKSKIIKRECCLCKNDFVMTTNDYFENNCGLIFHSKEEIRDSWICKSCLDKVQEIKNML